MHYLDGHLKGSCLGQNHIDLGNFQVLPGQTYTFAITFTSPLLPGDYLTIWQLERKGKIFGHAATAEVIVQ